MSEEINQQEVETTNSESKLVTEKNSEIEAASQKISKANTAVILKETKRLSEPVTETEAKKQMSRRSRRGFLIGGVSALVGIFGWRWMSDETKNTLFEKTFKFNEKVSQIFYSPKRLAPEFSSGQITESRVNGALGLNEDFNVTNWRLQVIGLANAKEFPQYSENILYDNESAAPPKRLDAPPVTDISKSGLLLTMDILKLCRELR